MSTLTIDGIEAMMSKVRPLHPPLAILVDRLGALNERVQFRFPRSKRKRIRKKWRLDNANFHTVEGDAVMFERPLFFGGTEKVLLVPPQQLHRLKRAFGEDPTK